MHYKITHNMSHNQRCNITHRKTARQDSCPLLIIESKETYRSTSFKPKRI